MIKKIIAALNYSMTRVLALYVIVILLTYRFFNVDQIFHRARLKTLNRMASSDCSQITDVVEKGLPLDKEILEEYRFYYEKVIEYLDYGADGYGLLAFFNYYLGNEKGAVDFYEEALQRMPDFFIFNYNLGVIYFQKGEYEKALQCLKKAVLTDLNRNFELITSSRLFWPYFNKDTEAIERDLKLRGRDNHLNAYKMLVFSSYHLKKFSEVIQFCNEALTVSLPDDEFFLYYLGLAMYELKQYDESIRFMSRVIKKDEKHGDAFYYIGMGLNMKGKRQEAQGFLYRAEIFGKDKDREKEEQFKNSLTVKLF